MNLPQKWTGARGVDQLGGICNYLPGNMSYDYLALYCTRRSLSQLTIPPGLADERRIYIQNQQCENIWYVCTVCTYEWFQGCRFPTAFLASTHRYICMYFFAAGTHVAKPPVQTSINSFSTGEGAWMYYRKNWEIRPPSRTKCWHAGTSACRDVWGIWFTFQKDMFIQSWTSFWRTGLLLNFIVARQRMSIMTSLEHGA